MALPSKVLVANRARSRCGSSAPLRELGIATVAVYSEADRGALHAAVRGTSPTWSGPGPLRRAYLAVRANFWRRRALGG